MKFLRKSLTNKAVFIFSVFTAIIVVVGIIFNRKQIESISLNAFLVISILALLVILLLFIFDIVVPVNRLIKQVRNLLTGKNYQRIDPITIDEVGVFTHFFNEITTDLEKISYDIKERRRMSSELDIAASIQKNVLPKVAPETPGLDVVAKTRAAAEVGGDVFNFYPTPDGSQVYFYIGDVTGHGVPAGLIMMMADTLINAMVSQNMHSGKDIIVYSNQLLTHRISSRLFMTTVVLRWDKKMQKMYYTGAGHEHILVYRFRTETVDKIQSGGIALGMIPDASKVTMEKEIPLEIGDSIVLYSDGITEAKNQTGEMYGLDRLAGSLKKHGYRPSPESIFDNLTKDFSEFVGEYVQADDITMIVIKYLGPQAAASKIKLTLNIDEKKFTKSKKWDWTT